MTAHSDLCRASPAFQKMERWRRLPRALAGGLDEILAESLGKNSTDTGGTGQPGAVPAAASRTDFAILPKSEEETTPMYEFRARHLTEPPTDFDDAVANVVGTVLPAGIAFDEKELGRLYGLVREWWRNVDGNGAQGDAFIKDRGEDAVTEGLSAILADVVDDPASPTYGRPYWQPIDAAQIPYIRIAYDPVTERQVVAEVDVWDVTSDGAKRLRRFFRGNLGVSRKAAAASRRGADQGGAHFERYATFEEYLQQSDDKGDLIDEYAQVGHGGPGGRSAILPPENLPDEIESHFVDVPIFPVYSGYVSPWFARPRLLKLADLCRIKMSLQSGHCAALYYSVPREVIVGMSRQEHDEYNEGETIKAGGGWRQYLKEGADYKFAEPEGLTFAAVAEQIEKLQARIDRAAFQVMSERATGSELTATGIVAAENRRVVKLDVDHAWWEQGIGRAISRAAWYLAAFAKLTPVETLPFKMPAANRSALADPDKTVSAAQTALQSDKLAPKTYVRVCREVGRWPEAVTPEDVERELREYETGAGGALSDPGEGA